MIKILFPKDIKQELIFHASEIFKEKNIPFYVQHNEENVSFLASEGKEIAESLVGSVQIQEFSLPYPLVSRKFHPEDSVVSLGSVSFQKDSFTLIAGPCSIENKAMISDTAQFLSGLGIKILRGGTYKCRTSPYSFQGNEHSLEYLQEIARKFSMKTVTEVLGEDLLEETAKVADMLQIGSRNSQNVRLLQKVGMQKKPVLLKRGFMNTMQEFFLSAEYIALTGNNNIILCERGIRTFENATRNTLDIAAIPVAKKETHLPIIIDPSHAAGRRDIIPALVKAGMVAGAQGAIIEVHPDPEHALSDGKQSLNFQEFEKLLGEIRTLAQAINIQIL
ncbi:MAG: 3-deoxy-7-phosphoheptulonate synthase [Candidatus Brocadiae bacterium]|nr:3-deoxy-7-phosphoheptulonate synthase [Candidatus Brocadiia bacterium]